MLATLEKIVIKEGKPVEVLFTTNDPEMLKLSISQCKLMQEKPCDLNFKLRLSKDGDNEEDQLTLNSGDEEEEEYHETSSEDIPSAPPEQTTLYRALSDNATFSDCKDGMSDEDLEHIIRAIITSFDGVFTTELDGNTCILGTNPEGVLIVAINNNNVLVGDEVVSTARDVLEIPYPEVKVPLFDRLEEGSKIIYVGWEGDKRPPVVEIVSMPDDQLEKVTARDTDSGELFFLSVDEINQNYGLAEDIADIAMDEAKQENEEKRMSELFYCERQKCTVHPADCGNSDECLDCTNNPQSAGTIEAVSSENFDTTPADEPDIDRANAENALYDALMATPGAKERWGLLSDLRPTDADIKNQLITEFNGGQTEGSSTGWDAGIDEDDGEPYFSPGINECSWTGNELISIVRAILNLSYPIRAESEGSAANPLTQTLFQQIDRGSYIVHNDEPQLGAAQVVEKFCVLGDLGEVHFAYPGKCQQAAGEQILNEYWRLATQEEIDAFEQAMTEYLQKPLWELVDLGTKVVHLPNKTETATLCKVERKDENTSKILLTWGRGRGKHNAWVSMEDFNSGYMLKSEYDRQNTDVIPAYEGESEEAGLEEQNQD